MKSLFHAPLVRSFLLLIVLLLTLGVTRGAVQDYDAAIRADVTLGLKPLASLTNAVSFFRTNRQAFAFGSTAGNTTLEFILEGDAVAGGLDGFLAVGVNATSSLRFEQYNNSGQMGFTLNGVADYLFSPAVPSPNIPVHVAYVWKPSVQTMKLYLNGSLAGSRSGVGSAFAMPRGAGYLGNSAAGTEGMQGTLHRVTVYAGIVEEDAIRRHANAFNGIRSVPDILSFSANPEAVFSPDPSTLSWVVTNASQVLLSGQDVTAFSGLTLNPNLTTEYELVAINESGSSTARVTVVVDPAPRVVSFISSQKFATAGSAVVLSWATLYGNTFSLAPDIGSVDAVTHAGAGSIEVRPKESTEYRLTVTGPFGTATRSLAITIGHPSDRVVISEFMADNSSSVVDEDGDHSDWIELFNPTSRTLSLQGYALTDDRQDPTRWPLPRLDIAAGEYRVVFASGKNRIDPAHPLHTNFRLSKSGSYLGLSDLSGAVVQDFGSAFPPQFRDVSYGVLGGDPSLGRYFGVATPGGENLNSPVPPRPVDFSEPSGTFLESFTLSLSSESTNALIRYTVDGTVPSVGHGLTYTGPIAVSASGRFRAISIDSGLSSDLSAANYLHLGADLMNYTSSLPIVVIENFGAGVIPQKGWSGDGSGVKQRPRQPAVWATFDRRNGFSALTNRPQMISRMGIRGRGAFSSTWRQKPFSVDAYDAADGSLDVSPLGMPAHSEWILYFPDPDDNKDPAMLFNTFAYDLSRDMGGRYSVRFRWVEAFVNEDGGDLRLADRRGVYAIIEKVARGKDRLDFQPLSLDGATGGWLLDLNRMDAEPETGWPAPNGARQPWFFHTAGPNRKVESKPNSQVSGDDLPQQSNGYLNFDTPNGYIINTNQRAAIEGWFKRFEDVFFNNAVWRDPTHGYRRYLDTRDFTDYFILNVLTRNGDGLLISMFPWKGDDDRLRMGPAWDYNWSPYYISGSPTGDLNYRSDQLWYSRLFTDPDFSQEYIDRWWQLRAGPLSGTNMETIIDRQMADIGPARSLLNGMPSVQEWATRLTTLKTWLKTRANWMDSNYLRPPQLSRDGGLVANGFQLAIGATNGTIYFTTDGSDPRAPGGSVSASSISYSAPIVINAQVTVKARVRKGTAWSGLTAAVFYPPQDLSKLALTEIHYNPQISGIYVGDDLEFVELKNRGDQTLDLGTLSFDSGIRFTFPAHAKLAPGAFYVLGRNVTALESRYPGLKVDGVYPDKLANGGEILSLLTPQGGIVFSIAYNDRAPWPIAADGFGYSVVPRAGVPVNSDRGEDWRASTVSGGSPGADDPEPSHPRIVINEVLTHSLALDLDQVELFNPEAYPVDLGGWFLSDDPSQPRKFRIPPQTFIDAGGFRVFTETDFNPAPGSLSSFSLSANGDSIYLCSGDAQTNLTGYSQGFAFGAAEVGASFGRYLNSVGVEQFPLQRSVTMGDRNSGPSVGPVVIQEIAYHPDLSGDEFIELRNLTATDVALFDVRLPENTWRINGVGYAFPIHSFLPANGLALVTAGDPESFRVKYGIADSTPIFGPYPGVLQGRGERLQLQRPGTPDTNGVPYITVDEIDYDDQLPWPSAADGSGASLQRLSVNEYGNDPANWLAAIPTPGRDRAASDVEVSILGAPMVQYSSSQEVELSIVASGSAPLRFQWLFNGSPILEGTEARLRIKPLLPAQAGNYSVVVFNSSSSATSASARVALPEAPLIFVQPQSRAANLGTNVTLTVGALGVGALRYQWFFQGMPIDQATNVTLVITNIQTSHAGIYQAFVSDQIGGAYSAAASLSVTLKPSILSSLSDQTVVLGESVRLDLQVGGTPPFIVKWRRGTTVLATVTVDGNSLSYTVTNIQTTQSAKYSALVSNPAGANIPSNDAYISVLADTDRDHIPDVYETATPGLSPTNAADATQDFDRDGFSNLQEYQAGTNPNDASSFLKWDDIHPSDAGVILRFQAVSNRTYSVQFKTDLAGVTWSNLVSVPLRVTNTEETIVDPALNAQGRFYRLITPQ